MNKYDIVYLNSVINDQCIHNIRYMHSGEVIYNKAIYSAQKRISAKIGYYLDDSPDTTRSYCFESHNI